MTHAGHEIINQFYGHKLRIRVCGICIQNKRLLLVKHLGLGNNGYVWLPPGGGLNFGETAPSCLIREFREETGLHIHVKDFLFVYEFHEPPLHAIELFFAVAIEAGQVIKGKDPEMNDQQQIIDEVKFMSNAEIRKEKKDNLHHILSFCKHPNEILAMKGYFKN